MDLEKQWSSKNSLSFSAAKSSHKYLWECPVGHEWRALYANRKNGSGCPYCSSRKISAGQTSLAAKRPDLIAQWSSKNDKLATEVGSQSSYRAIWCCETGHEWQARVADRARSVHPTNCPYCSGRKAIVGETDLATVDPELASQLSSLNLPLKAQQLTSGSNRKLWWLGPCGHEWEATVIERRGSAGRRGTGCPFCAGKRAVLGATDLQTLRPDLGHQLDDSTAASTEVTLGSNQRLRWRCERDHTWFATVADRVAGHDCPRCASAKHASSGEEEVADYMASLLGKRNIERHVKTILSGRKEIDIYVPTARLAVEYNGVYWHSDPALVPANQQHAVKWREAAAANIQLLQIWEDDWRLRPEVVKNMLRAKLGVAQEAIGARKTTAISVPHSVAVEFFDRYHLQGSVRCKWYFGLTSIDGQLVALVGLKSNAGSSGRSLQIVRYATALTVQGGFTKLLKHVDHALNPLEYTTFSDHMVSDGALYEKNGFVKVAELPVDYSYVVGNIRVHKFSYRLAKFKSDPTLVWQAGLNEKQLAQLNNLRRAWDAGKSKWRLQR